MIDIHGEQMLTISHAARELPGHPHISTLWRWVQRGCRGVRLETILVGGIRYTSREALQRYCDAITAAADGTSTVTASTPSARRKAHERACAELDAAGI